MMLWRQAMLCQVLWIVKFAEVSLASVTQDCHNGVSRANQPGRLNSSHAVHCCRTAHKEAIIVQEKACHLHCLSVCPLKGLINLQNTAAVKHLPMSVAFPKMPWNNVLS